MTIGELKRVLCASTAVLALSMAVPAVAQNQLSGDQRQESRQDTNQTSRQSPATASGDDRGGGQGDRARMDRTAADFSDQRNFSRVRVGEANQLIGRMLGTQDGRPGGDVEYLLIEPTSGKVMYFLVGLGNWYTWDQQLAAVPFDAVSIRQVDGDDDDGDNIDLTLVGGTEVLRNAPRLSDRELSNLTSPRVQYRIQNYWAPLMPASAGDDGNQGATGAGQASRGSQSTTGAGGSAGGRSAGGTSAGSSAGDTSNMAPGRIGDADRSGSQQAGRTTTDNISRGMGQQASGNTSQQQRQQGTPADATSDGQSRNRQQQSQPSTGGDAGSAADGNQSGQQQRTYTLVGRSYITALAPPTVMRPDQIRGATVTNRDGEEVGSLERLVIDMDRGYVAYAIVSEGGFLGMGEQYRPIPLQALQWQRDEAFMLPRSADQLKRMPKLREIEMPTSVRRTDVERLYASYGVTPYWEQGRDETRSTAEGNQGSDSGQANTRSNMTSSPDTGTSTGSIGPQPSNQSTGSRSSSGSN